ncbi:MAG: Flp pilus assembly complex ATPase component TadA, partial [Armatimonadota bacterium]|nr:Flp pilus assembly complex ATPase component TadA [Armatimonadota bacterium]
MIFNDSDLLPLIAEAEKARPKPAEAKPAEASDGFAAQIADTFDSVELLLAARAEAEEAENKAKSGGETALPFLREDKKGAARPPEPGRRPGGMAAGGFTVATAAQAGDSPAPVDLLGSSDLLRLSDATNVAMSPSARDFMGGLGAMTLQEAAARVVVSGDTRDLSDIHIDDLLRMTVESGASDLHLSVHLPPMVRKDGKLVPLPFEKATDKDTQRIVFDILNNTQIEHFERTHELDFSYGVKGVGRFRFNVYRQRSSVGCAMRVIPNTVPTMEQLKLPPVLKTLTHKHSGLVLVTGPTGSGKSTTIASMIDIINTERE